MITVSRQPPFYPIYDVTPHSRDMAVTEETAGKDWERNPDMELAQMLFLLTNKCDSEDLGQIRKAVMQKIERQSVFACILVCVHGLVCGSSSLLASDEMC